MLDNEIFLNIVSATPLVSIDLIVMRGEHQILLGLRNNKPAQGFWFVPGGRIFKNELIKTALDRIAEKELGIDLKIANLIPQYLGLFEHFYSDCFFGDVGISTHYVVLGHILKVPKEFLLPNCDEQHSEFRWWKVEDATSSPIVHKFTKDYLISSGQFPAIRGVV